MLRGRWWGFHQRLCCYIIYCVRPDTSMLRGGWGGFHRRLCCYVFHCARLDIFILCQFKYSWSKQKYIGTMPVSCLKKKKQMSSYVEIKCQLDATEVLLQILLVAQHVLGATMPIIRSSRVLYGGCCLWYFVLWFSSCCSGVQLRVMCLVYRMLQHPANRTHNPQLMGVVVLETC